MTAFREPPYIHVACVVLDMAFKFSIQFRELSETLSFEPSNSERMPLNEEPIFETLSRAQNSMYHIIC